MQYSAAHYFFCKRLESKLRTSGSEWLYDPIPKKIIQFITALHIMHSDQQLTIKTKKMANLSKEKQVNIKPLRKSWLGKTNSP